MLDKIKEIITEFVDVEPDEIKEDTQFISDLGFNSYDFMSFLGEIEDEFDIEVNEREVLKIRTVGEAIDYIKALQEQGE